MTRNTVLARLARSRERLDAPLDSAGAIERRRGDFQTNPGIVIKQPLVPAAVLVPLVDRPDGMTVMLTQRTDHLVKHAGQISFPGGRLEAGDVSPAAAALRETEEEVGLPASQVSIVGRLDDYVTGTGFLIAPVVGIVRVPYDVKLDPYEVADLFEVPLSFFLDPANHQRHSRMLNGIERHYYAMPYGERYIWGATASMLVNLYDVLAG
ncbi:MAG: CoA pyrophosphatase [Alphaproteobacteria bacterium]